MPRLRIAALLAAASLDPDAHLDAALVERYGAGVGAEQRGVSAEEAASRVGRYDRCGRRPENAGRGIDHAS